MRGEQSFTLRKEGCDVTDTKEKILLTALRLFARDGYEAVSVGELADALGVTKGALWLTKKIALWIKSLFLRKESAK